jgi:integrative and conjugative element protein (TIGR02256 family)
VRIQLDKAVRRRLKSELRRAGRREIGGVLMGEQLAVGHFQVIDLSIDAITGSEAHFVRSKGEHVAALREFFERTGGDYARYNYLGEWHSHPCFPIHPSKTDVDSMTELVEGERDITFAALLIVRLDMWFHLRHSISLFVRGRPHQSIHMS